MILKKYKYVGTNGFGETRVDSIEKGFIYIYIYTHINK